MNKTELIAAVAEKAGLTKKDVEKAVAALLETVKGEVAKKGKVQLIGFGTFEAGKAFKDAVNAAPAKKHKK